MLVLPSPKAAFRLLFSLLTLGFLSIQAKGQLTVDPTPTPQQLVQNVLVGSGVTVSNVTYNGDSVQIGSFDASNANLLSMNEGLMLSSGAVTGAIGPNDQQSTTTYSGGTGGSNDPDLYQANGNIDVHDEAILEFDFVPAGDTVEFQYVFGSEEYSQYVGTTFNDVFGFFLSGPGINGSYTNNAINLAEIPGTNQAVSINNVNGTTNSTYYVNNGDGDTVGAPAAPYSTDSAYIQYDGHTVVLTALAEVQCDSTYHMKIGIADGGDDILDSGVFLKGGSLFSDAVEVDVTSVSGDSTVVENCTDATFELIRNDTSDADTINYDIGGDAINGTDYSSIPDSVVIPSGDSSATITIDPLDEGVNETGLDTVSLTVYTINPCGDTIVNEASVFIMDEYDVPLTMTDQILPCPMDSVPLVAQADSGMPDFDYQWSDGTTGDTAYLSGNSSDTLSVTATDSCGMTGTDSAFVDLQWTPMSMTLTPDTVFGCYGNSSIDLNATVNGGGPPYSYSWSPGGGSGSTFTVSPDSTTMYEVVVMDSCQEDTLTDSVLVEVPMDPIDIQVSTPTPDSSVVEGCLDGSFTFIRPDTSVFDTLYYSISGDAVNGSDYGQIGDSVLYGQGDTASSVMIDALVDGVNESTDDTVTVSTYFVNVCEDTVRSEASIYIQQDYQIQALASDTTLYCPTDSIPLHVVGQGGNAPYDFSWSDGTNDDSTYVSGDVSDTLTVTATDSCGQTSAPDTVVIDFQYDSLSVTTNNDTTVACPGDPVDLTATVTGGHSSYSYTWTPGGVSGQTTTVNLNNSAGYQVSVTDSCGVETATDSVYVTVPDPDPLEAVAPDTTVQCVGDSIVLVGSAQNGFGGYDYDWQGGPNDSTWGMLSYNDSLYVLEVTDQCGNTDTDSSLVTHPDYDPLMISTGPTDTTCIGDPLKVDADASGGAGGYSYDWNGSGSIDLLQDGKALITPKKGGIFTATVTDACGDQAQDDVYLGVRGCELHIPNVISPNGDGDNEAFVIKNLEHYPKSSLTVFNRWGNEVFHDPNYQNDWKGGDLSDGTYFFILRPGGDELDPVQGQVTLFSDGK
ncbi:MAG: choice-of-anchor L domain-containing protein [Flavobacteriales bacterium]